MGNTAKTYYVVYEFHTRWLQRRTLIGALVEIQGGLREVNSYNALHQSLLKQSQKDMGVNKAWSLVVLNWIVLPGSE